MRLVLKLTMAIVVANCIILLVYGYLRVRRVTALIEEDMKRDHYAMGRAFAVAVVDVWREDGADRALTLIDNLNEQEKHVIIRWVWLDASATEPSAPRVPLDQLEGFDGRRAMAGLAAIDSGETRLYTYVPVDVGEPRRGAIELSESLALEADYIRTMIVSTIFTLGLIAALSGLIAMVMGAWLVGRPIRSLIARARRIGAGDFSGLIELRQRDEIGKLAVEMNLMSAGLADANERLAAEANARIAALDQLRHADRLATVGTLASGVAHELGTPLNIVAARAKMAVSGEVTGQEAIENARIIADQSQRMTNIIRQLLDFVRRHRPEKARTDLSQLAQEVVSLLAPLAAKRHVSLSLDVGGVLATIDVDATQLHQALTNLVVNGIQAMPGGGQVRLRLSREHAQPPVDVGGPAAEFLRLDVSDDGEGIRESAIDHIFEPFFTTKGAAEGTGLGLSVAYGIVREHGGWITVQSTAGQGSCFSVYLPYGAAS